MRRFSGVLLLAVVGILAACPACVKRTLSIRSDTPGAMVYLDGMEIGRTPLANVPFHFYGTREIALYADGYLVERRTVEIATPWYSRFPIDIFSELIVPWDIHDRRAFYFEMKRDEPIEHLTLMRHAHETREVALVRIDGARQASDYRPPAYVVKDEPKPFFLWGPFVPPPRADPTYPEPLPPLNVKPEEKK